LEDRFWSRVNKRGPIPSFDAALGSCWIWTSSLDKNGYGTFSGLGQSKAHRFSFLLANGALAQGSFVCHRCDNRACVRPSHLYLGDAGSNGTDASARKHYRYGHHPVVLRGSQIAKAKMTDSQVAEARRRYAAGARLSELMQTFDMSKSGIQALVTGRTWKHVTIVGPIVGEGHASGERHGGSVLKEADVRDIRLRHARGDVTMASLAGEYHVNGQTIADIVKRKLWRHLS
jgi:hypothetical protein